MNTNMVKVIIIAFLAVVSMSFLLQTDDSAVVKALKSGNADEVSNYFDKILDIKFPDKDEVKNIGKNQAGIALKSFFEENKITGFKLLSQGELNGTISIAGKLLNSTNGYNITMMLQMKDGKHQIITVRVN